jgi:hypothetical protein
VEIHEGDAMLLVLISQKDFVDEKACRNGSFVLLQEIDESCLDVGF